MSAEKSTEEPLTTADKQRYLDRIAELELENSYLKAENAALKAEISVLQDEKIKAESEPEFSKGWEETTKNHK